MRRGPGIAALDRSLYSTQQYSQLGDQLTSSQLSDLRSQLETFSSALRHFSSKHRQEIRKNPTFRHAFQKMCYSIGVDPLSSSGDSRSKLWNDLLGLGDWSYELAVQIIDVCVSTRHLNGGLIEINELIKRVATLRTGTQDGSGITEEDVSRSIKTLKPLGCGYQVVTIGNKTMVQSVPRELGTDTLMVLAILSLPPSSSNDTRFDPTTVQTDSTNLPFATEDLLMLPRPALKSSGGKPAWTRERANAVLHDMLLREDMLWIDEQAYPPRYYSLAIGGGEALFTRGIDE